MADKESNKQTNEKFKLAYEQARQDRATHFKDVTDEDVWKKLADEKKKGFSMVPRSMPYMALIMDSLSPGKPVSSTFFALWCRDNYNAGFLNIKSEKTYAIESGFFSSRQESTWRSRMRILKKFGFIKQQKGTHGEFNYVAILDPYQVIKKLYLNGEVKHNLYETFMERTIEIDADEAGLLREAWLTKQAKGNELE